MFNAPGGTPPTDQIESDSRSFYRRVLQTLSGAQLPFLVGGAFSFAWFTGIRRNTKDLDLFIRRDDYDAVADALGRAGYPTAVKFSHWLAKVDCGDAFVDLIFNSGNALSPVDDSWFEHATQAEVLGVPVRIVAPEESLWTKAFIMERERYDGADVAHLLHACAPSMDWPRLLRRFGVHWRVLLAHLVLYGFVYPGERSRIPAALLDELTERLRRESRDEPPATRLCAGTLLSREQYLVDVEQLGYADARIVPRGNLTPAHAEHWTRSIPGRH